MIVKEPYVLYEGAIPRKKCEEIIQRGTSSLQEAKVFNETTENIRKSNIAWLHDKDLFQLVSPYVLDANTNAGWNYEVSMYESLQFTCYEQNGHYGWHADWGSDIHAAYTEQQAGPGNPRIGKIRKLSMTLDDMVIRNIILQMFELKERSLSFHRISLIRLHQSLLALGIV